jgi:hypothetical protein
VSQHCGRAGDEVAAVAESEEVCCFVGTGDRRLVSYITIYKRLGKVGFLFQGILGLGTTGRHGIKHWSKKNSRLVVCYLVDTTVAPTKQMHL